MRRLGEFPPPVSPSTIDLFRDVRTYRGVTALSTSLSLAEFVKKLKLGTRVQFTDDRIPQLDSISAKRYRQRVGTVVGYRSGAQGPLGEFDADEGRRSEILQDVAPAYLTVLPE
jgi:hypothetical protein